MGQEDQPGGCHQQGHGARGAGNGEEMGNRKVTARGVQRRKKELWAVAWPWGGGGGGRCRFVWGLPWSGVCTQGPLSQGTIYPKLLLPALAPEGRRLETSVGKVLTMVLLNCFLHPVCLILSSVQLLTSQAVRMPVNHAKITVS